MPKSHKLFKKCKKVDNFKIRRNNAVHYIQLQPLKEKYINHQQI